ncbi:MAG: LacI family DNA-binding transcriptional regulator [Anaerolineales bacterium]|nr:LacI family DNA-binding transcriptional regulator [Anaerolineales bacterium]
MSVTIRDVAKQAGVGLATVSRVINNSPLVSAATREKVSRIIAELDYHPNPTARRLSLGKTLTIAVVTPFFTRPAFVERLRGIHTSLIDTDYDLVLYNVETTERRDAYMRSVPRRERVDGVLIVSLPPRNEDLISLANCPVPIVMIDANHPSLTMLHRIVINDVTGGQCATEHLIALGHQRVAYLSDTFETPFNFTASYDRYRGYRQALERAGLHYRPEYVVAGEHSHAVARQMALGLLRLPEPPTAIFAASDTQALGVLEAAQVLGLRVPEQLSVIGYDDIEVAEYLGLTTMRQQLFESGRRGVALLMEAIAGRHADPVCEEMPVTLVERRTTAPPA